MNETPAPNPLILDLVLDIDSIPENALLLFRVKELSKDIYAAIEGLQTLYGDKLKSKNISFLVLKPDTKIEMVKPEYLESLGWVNKNSSRIIH